MKHILLILAMLGLMVPVNHLAAQDLEPEQSHLQPISLEEVTQKMADKESFSLYVGREDSVATQKGKKILSSFLASKEQQVFYLDTRQIDHVAYRKYARRYKIRSTSYLAHFKGKKQVRRLGNLSQETAEELNLFFEEGN